MRRLPVYLLLDCSESMAGPGIEEMNKGVKRLIDELESDPHALDTAHLSIITFSRAAEVLVPLSEIGTFEAPDLKVRTGTAFGAALRLLVKSIQDDVIKTTADTKGDYRPLVFVFSDGQPTDSWEEVCKNLKGKGKDGPGIANVYAFGCGPDADPGVLGMVTDIVFMMKDLSHEVWQKLFIWISASISSASVSVKAAGELPVRLPGAPDDVVTVPPDQSGPSKAPPKQVFLHAQCQGGGGPYLMRYLKQGENVAYQATAAHPLDEIEKDADAILSPINSNELSGVPPCPYCSNPGATSCDCGTMMCFTGKMDEMVTCPNCGALGRIGTAPAGGHAIPQVEG